MILAYLPDQNLGHVNNFGMGNNGGGVRVLIECGTIPRQEAAASDRQFLIALYSRKTTSEPTHRTDPRLRDPGRLARDGPLEPTSPLRSGAVRDLQIRTRGRLEALRHHAPGSRQAKAEREGHGILLRFLSEDVRGPNWSGYDLVSREGAGQWASRRPLLLVVKAANAEKTPAN